MLVALIGHDRPGHLDTRKANRDAHLDYIRQTGKVAMAGPLLSGDGAMCGSLIVLEVTDVAEAQVWAANDPYAKAGLFASVDLMEWNKVIG